MGASAEKGWAKQTHIPALRALPEYEFIAACTSRPESAQRAAEVYHTRYAFSDYRDLVRKETEAFRSALKKSRGKERAEAILSGDLHVNVFPALLFQEHLQSYRVLRPVAVDRTEVFVYPYRLKGAPEEFNDVMVKGVCLVSAALGFMQAGGTRMMHFHLGRTTGKSGDYLAAEVSNHTLEVDGEKIYENGNICILDHPKLRSAAAKLGLESLK